MPQATTFSLAKIRILSLETFLQSSRHLLYFLFLVLQDPFVNLYIIFSEAMEEFNLPSEARLKLLTSLQEMVGDVPPFFWAACQVCDVEALKKLIEHARISSGSVRILASQTRGMSQYGK
jgi:hypothetical protein